MNTVNDKIVIPIQFLICLQLSYTVLAVIVTFTVLAAIVNQIETSRPKDSMSDGIKQYKCQFVSCLLYAHDGFDYG